MRKTVVKEQRLPDENFLKCPYPNSEIKESLALGLEYCKKYNGDLMFASDSDYDSDLVGIVVKDENGEYHFLNGNEVDT